MSSCRRCGLCCMSVPKWDDLSNVEKAFIRMNDPEAEEIFREVKDKGCPNLKFENGKAVCSIYSKRCNFCKALKPDSEQCKFARSFG